MIAVLAPLKRWTNRQPLYFCCWPPRHVRPVRDPEPSVRGAGGALAGRGESHGRRPAVLPLRYAQGVLLLTGIVFVMGMINSYFTPEAHPRAAWPGTPRAPPTVMARASASHPFCSCSAVPLFIGFVQAGVPLA